MSSVDSLRDMFKDCKNLCNLDISEWTLPIDFEADYNFVEGCAVIRNNSLALTAKGITLYKLCEIKESLQSHIKADDTLYLININTAEGA